MSTPQEIETFKGYVPLDEYKRRREQLQNDLTLKAVQGSVARSVGLEAAHGSKEASAGTGVGGDASTAVASKKKRKKNKVGGGGVGLSFDDGEEDDAESLRGAPAPPAKKSLKAPGVDTSFLAMTAAEKEEHAKLQQQKLVNALERQRQAKEEEVLLRYTFRNESAKKLLGSQFYKGEVHVRRGDTVAAVVERIHAKLCSDLSEKVSSDLLLVAANDYLYLIMQPHVTLFDIGALEWREGGAIFDLAIGQVHLAERGFYETNKHLNPMVHWTLYDGFTTFSQEETIRNRGKAPGVAVPNRGGTKGGGPGGSGAIGARKL